MTPHLGGLLARYRTTERGELYAWSIQERFGIGILVVGFGLSLTWFKFLLEGARPEGFWWLAGVCGFINICGFAIVRLRETLRVDELGVHHEYRQGFQYFRWHAPRDVASQVMLKALIDGHSESTTTRFTVSLEVAAEDHTLEFPFYRVASEAPAREAAIAVAHALRLPMVDAIGDTEKVLPFEGLHHQRPDRESTEGAAPDRIEERLHGGHPALSIRGAIQSKIARRFRAAGLGASGFAFGCGALASQVMNLAWFGWIIPFPFWGAGLFFYLYGYVGERANEQVRVEAGKLIHQIDFAGRSWRRNEIDCAGVHTLRVQSSAVDARGVAVVSDRKRFVVGASLEAEEMEWLRCWLSQRVR